MFAMDKIDAHDREVLRGLSSAYAIVSGGEQQAQTAELWRAVNDLHPVRPMVWINEIPWHEMEFEGELSLQCTGVVARRWETQLRRTLYMWKHMRGDMVLNPWLSVQKHYTGGSFSLDVEEQIVSSDPANTIVSHGYVPLIHDEHDVQRLVRFQHPVYLKGETEAEFEQLQSVCEGIIPVKLAGIRHIWFTPWDNLIRLWGVQEALLDLYLKADLVSFAVETYVQRAMELLEAFEQQQLLSPGAGNVRVGSGGYGYSSDLPEVDSAEVCTPQRMWGCSNAQIFSDVSPDMHWEFALRFDIPWLSKWGANYYGCCEALHRKVEIVERIPNLRKISMSPWADLPTAIRSFGARYVFSIKPNPAVFAAPSWDGVAVEQDLRRLLEPVAEARIPCEVIMKDISTVNYHPQRLWEWSQIASRVCEGFARAY
jgi:hypothetical protein